MTNRVNGKINKSSPKVTTIPIQNITRAKPPLFSQQGMTGLKVSQGFVHDEFLPQLTGERGRRVFREMADNDSTVSAILYAVEMALRKVEWRIESVPSSNIGPEELEVSQEHKDAREFLRGILFEDMEHSWDDFISEVLSMLTYGWSYHEIVYKRRMGRNPTIKKFKSAFDDGMIGVRKIEVRSQETLSKWELDEELNVMGMWQYLYNNGSIGDVYIPKAKALLFRPKPFRNSPEGRSILRGGYRSWFLLKNIEEVEAVAIEREMNGLPVIRVPNELLESDNSEDKSVVSEYLKLARDVKFNEQGGVIIPSDPFIDQDGRYTQTKMVDFELMTSRGRRNIDTSRTTTEKKFDIARTILADFIMLGANRQGSFALSKDKTETFYDALYGWAWQIAYPINRDLVPMIWELNNLDYQYMPRLIPDNVQSIDLGSLASYVRDLSLAGAPLFPDERLEAKLRDVANLPEKDYDEEFAEKQREAFQPTEEGTGEEEE